MGKLTVRAIENAKPRDKAYKLMDGDGLQLRVATDGNKTWLVRYMVKGTERQYRLPKPYRDTGGAGFASLQDAREEAARIRALARQGFDYPVQMEQERLAQERQRQAEMERLAKQAEAQRRENLSVRDLFDVWTRDGVRRKDGNAELQRSFNADVLPTIGNIPVQQLTEHDVRNVLRTMVSRGVNRAAVVLRNNLTQMFAWAEKRQPWRKLLAEGNPVDLIEIDKIVSPEYDLQNRRDRILSADEIRELHGIFERMQEAYACAPNKRVAVQPIDHPVQRALWIMLSTLCRVGELSMARWDHVDFDARTWFIPKENVKGGREHFTVHLSDFALDQFHRLHGVTGHTEWCFRSRNREGHVDVKSISKQVGDRQAMFKKGKDGGPRKPMQNRRHDNILVLGQGLNGAWTPHDLRRTGATMMQELGVPLEVIDRCQNHVLEGSKVRRHYLHHDYANEKRQAWQRLGSKLSQILETSDSFAPLP
ncbi:tyrosine-type recombinase/integrase [Noviherbaspirillum sp. CPCC 100848]|uniref:Tyrosine-type recombinase/integrase n=1 Tax=Noviherbaspirillum album TaxID=3080276 RepID=A0ABU6JHZ3_9BURK|nr:tyrosine-type recombinase/integrase [Noviherbaspirillum sp. CPCC 100848]MEC4723294.1 tyrosine-type recombinase/integrase [Noviherbaspirillum sp. CPCC 100848]